MIDYIWGAVIAALVGIVALRYLPRSLNWRSILARAPLPMLALAASYGVYSYALLFVPAWVAVVQAAAFETTYIGLAVTQGLTTDQRKRATAISIGAVVTSIVYNTLAGWFYRQPALLESAGAESWLMFAVLHGAPLAWVAYLVADLLLHAAPVVEPAREPQAEPQDTTTDPLAALRAKARELRDAGWSWQRVADAVERSPSTVRGWLES